METKQGIKLRAESITATTKLTETIYCGWMAQNIGTAPKWTVKVGDTVKGVRYRTAAGRGHEQPGYYQNKSG